MQQFIQAARKGNIQEFSQILQTVKKPEDLVVLLTEKDHPNFQGKTALHVAGICRQQEILSLCFNRMQALKCSLEEIQHLCMLQIMSLEPQKQYMN